ncbi:MAG: hypothetical protein KIT84_31135 [Labilithrix sp.]|nr:hypothetical protein [Labilithrix sp.]MCW5815523.1 hypothetical protein [Labilithrix sp.]
MMKLASSLGLVVAVLGGVVCAAGCSVGSETGAAEGAVIAPPLDEARELDSILGDDRVGKVLRAQPNNIPGRFGDFEEVFKVGRKCNRRDSREIWTVEEKSTRITGAQEEANDLLPRLVIGGCEQEPGNLRQSFEMTVALVSDKSLPLADSIPDVPVEVMALDNTTGQFNFYVLEPGPTPTSNATVVRFVKLADDTVQKWTKVDGQPATKEDFPQRKCFNCHINGEPVMNELAEPWTNWVSSHKTMSRRLSGFTGALVSESRPFAGEHARSSLANQLEQVTKASISMWVEGIPGVPGSGFGQRVLDGKDAGGLPLLLRSVFCETTLNYEQVFNTVPMSLFMDKHIAGYAGFEPPLPPISGASWTLLPVRSEVDKRVEIFLQKKGILTPDTVLATRVFDDTHEIFSARRCALHADATSRLAPGVTVDGAIRAAILAALDADETTTTAEQRAFIRALIAPNVSSDARDAAELAYLDDITARLAKEIEQLDSAAGLETLAQRWTDRQADARALFPRPENPFPLPITPTVRAPIAMAPPGGDSTH